MGSRQRTALITGGAGFIGSHLSERLLNDDWSLVIVDDLNDFYSPVLKRANLLSIRSVGEFTFYNRDICDEAEMERIVAEHKPEVIIHLAARAGVRPSLVEPLLYERVNVQGTIVLLEAARRHRVGRFIFASSSSIYGAANSVPFSENDSVNLPISPYAATKIAGEKICFTYSHLYGIATVCLRFFTVYGPRQRPDLAIRKFIEMIDAGETITVFGDGATSRDYTYIADIVAGIAASIDHPCSFETFNLGNSLPVRLSEMIATIEAAVGQKARIRTLPDQPGDVPITFADISKAEKLLGYRPKVSFEEGIQRFVDAHLNRSCLLAHA